MCEYWDCCTCVYTGTVVHVCVLGLLYMYEYWDCRTCVNTGTGVHV